MRGKAARQATMLTAITPEALVPERHPIRRIKPMVDRALAQLSPTFDTMIAKRPANTRSIPTITLHEHIGQVLGHSATPCTMARTNAGRELIQ